MSQKMPKVSQKEPKGAKSESKGARREPKEAQREPKGAKGEAKGAQGSREGAEREPKGRPKWVRMLPKVCLRAWFGDLSVRAAKSGLILVTFLMKKTIKKRFARTLYSSTRKLMKFRCKNSL